MLTVPIEEKHGYKDEDIRILLDDSHFPDDRQPNTHNTVMPQYVPRIWLTKVRLCPKAKRV